MSSDPRLMALPALRKRAEEEAHQHFEAVRAALRANNAVAPMGLEWGNTAGFVRDAWTDAHLALLADISRPSSRDAVARLVGLALGMVNPPTAPSLRRYDAAGSPMPAGDGGFWTLYGDGDHEGQWHPFPTWRARPGRFYAPEIAATTDPTEALTLIAIATLTTTD